MLLETEITIDDYKAFLKMVKKANLKPSPALYVVYVLTGIVFTIFFLVSDISINLPTAVAVGLFIAVLAGAQVLDNQRKLQPESDGLMLGKMTLRIDDDGIHSTREHYESFAKWSGVKTVHETDTHYFVMLDRIGAHIIPKRSFSGGEQMREFKGLIGGNVGRSAL